MSSLCDLRVSLCLCGEDPWCSLNTPHHRGSEKSDLEQPFLQLLRRYAEVHRIRNRERSDCALLMSRLDEIDQSLRSWFCIKSPLRKMSVVFSGADQAQPDNSGTLPSPAPNTPLFNSNLELHPLGTCLARPNEAKKLRSKKAE